MASSYFWHRELCALGDIRIKVCNISSRSETMSLVEVVLTGQDQKRVILLGKNSVLYLLVIGMKNK